MKPKILSLWAVFFLSAIFLSLQMALAIGADWKVFGNTFNPMYQYQNSQFFGNFLTSNISTDNITLGYDTANGRLAPYQPLVSDLGTTTDNFIIIPYGNYLQVWDSDLNFVNEVFAGIGVLGQISAVDWDNDGNNNELIGAWQVGAGDIMSVRVYQFNFTSYALQLINETNFSLATTNIGSTGFRCSGSCYGVLWDYNSTFSKYSLYSLKINSSGYVATEFFVNSSAFPYEPPSIVDWDNDGLLEMAIFSNDNVIIYNENGVLEQLFNYSTGASYRTYFRSAKFTKSDNAVNRWRIAIAFDQRYSIASTNQFCSAGIYKIEDRTQIWGQLVIGSSGQTATTPHCVGMAIKDYNGDNYEDLWVYGARAGVVPLGTTAVYSGLDGSVLFTFSSTNLTNGVDYPDGQITLARISNSDSQFDFIVSGASDLAIVDTSLGTSRVLSGMGNNFACVPVDTDLDGVLEILCSKSTLTKIYDTNVSNQNAQISSVAFDPSTTIALSETLYMYVTASDAENDNPLYYIRKCDSGDSFSAEQTSSTLTCNYASLGYKNVTIGVRDYYHAGQYNYLSQEILVTQTGVTCNNDGICDSGETTQNCPNDCPATPQQNYTTAQGGISMNTQLVNPENTQQGLLPDIYYGILAFLSLVLSPTITIVFLFITILIIIAIAVIIKVIFHKAIDLTA